MKNNEIKHLTNAVQHLIQSNNDPDSESMQASHDYFSMYLTAKMNRLAHMTPDDQPE